MDTRFLLTSDVHQDTAKWFELEKQALALKPRFILIAGDLLPKTGAGGQKRFFRELKEIFGRIKRMGGVTIITFMGNDDYNFLEGDLDKLAAQGLCVNLNRKVLRESGFVFCGMPMVRDYPFRYKYWCTQDSDLKVCPEQFGPPFTYDECGQRVEIPELREDLSAKATIPEELEALRNQLSPAETSRSIWLVHQPPAGMGMDICSDGEQVGSPSLLEFIRQHQPLFGVSGHIHESPYQPGGKWLGVVENTLWFQAGQMESRLHFVSLDVASGFNVKNIRHSIFGSTAAEFERFSEP